MAETGQDVAIYAGNTVAIDVTILDSAGAALDLTGATLEWGMTTRFGTDASLRKTSESSSEIEITDAIGGLATVHLDPMDTAELTGSYRHELRIIDGADDIVTLLTGALTIRTSILD